MPNHGSELKAKRYHGVVVPMVTPFTPGGELDEPAVRRVIDHLIAGGVAGIFILGTTGEEASMPPAMRLRLAATAVEQAGGRATVYAGISDNCLRNSFEAADHFGQLGVDVQVARLPTYYRLDGREQLQYFLALVKGISRPLILYNISSTTHMTIPIAVVKILSQDPKVVGLKDSDDNPARLAALVAKLGARDDFSILVGVTSLSAEALALGADGTVPSPSNLVPGLCQRLYESAVRGDTGAAETYQAQLVQVGRLFRQDRSLAQSLGLLKAMMGALGLCGPHLLPPLPTPDEMQQEVVKRSFLMWRMQQG